jgi:hypothetical protein
MAICSRPPIVSRLSYRILSPGPAVTENVRYHISYPLRLKGGDIRLISRVSCILGCLRVSQLVANIVDNRHQSVVDVWSSLEGHVTPRRDGGSDLS